MTKVQSKNALLFDLVNDGGPLREALVETIGEGTTAEAGLISPEDKTKLDGIASGATVNAADAALRDRATHTGEQPISTITGLADALDGKATPADVAAALAGLVDSSPATLDTLNELAAALGDDPAFATTVSTALGSRLRVDAAQGLSAPQQAQGRDNLGLGSAALADAGDFATAAQGAKADVAHGRVYDTEADFSTAQIPIVLTVIETSGYFEFCDGGGHRKRRISTPAVPMPWQKPSADGAWWEIAEPVVNFAMFGADATGTTPADQQIKDTFDCAAAIGASVGNCRGEFLWRHMKIPVYVDAHLGKTNIKLDALSGRTPSTWDYEHAFVVMPNEETITFDADDLASLNDPSWKAQMVSGCTYFPHPLFLEHRDAFVSLRTDTTDIMRWSGEAIELRDNLVTGYQGMLTWGFDRTLSGATINGGFIYPREKTKRVFECPRFVGDACGSVVLVSVQRHWTEVYNFSFEEVNRPAGDMIRNLCEAKNCYGVNFYGGIADCPDQATASYAIGGGAAIDVHWHNWYAVDGWGATGLNYIKGWTWDRCQLNRIDTHWGMRGFNGVYRSLIKSGRIHTSGGGLFVSEDCTFQVGGGASANTQPYYECIATRGDYAYEWFGEVKVIRPRLVIGAEIADGSTVTVVKAGGHVNHDAGRTVYLPSVQVKDVVVQGADNHGAVTQGLNIVGVGLWDARIDSGLGRSMVYPDKIDVDGVSFIGFSPTATVHFSAVRGNHYGHVSVKGPRLAQIDGSGNTIQDGCNAEIIARNLTQLVNGRIVNPSTDRTYLLDFRHASTTWDAGYAARNADRWYPRIQVEGCRKAEMVVALKAAIFISASEVCHLDDLWGARTYPKVVIQGGRVAPWYRTSADSAPTIAADLVMLGVAVHAPVKADNTLGIFNLNGAKGMGNLMLTGAKTANVIGWDAAYASFWAI